MGEELARLEKIVRMLIAAQAFTFLVFLTTAWAWAGELKDVQEDRLKMDSRLKKAETYADEDLKLNRDIVGILDALNAKLEEIENAKRANR